MKTTRQVQGALDTDGLQGCRLQKRVLPPLSESRAMQNNKTKSSDLHSKNTKDVTVRKDEGVGAGAETGREPRSMTIEGGIEMDIIDMGIVDPGLLVETDLRADARTPPHMTEIAITIGHTDQEAVPLAAAARKNTVAVTMTGDDTARVEYSFSPLLDGHPI